MEGRTRIRWDRLGRWALIGVFALVLYLYIGPAVSWIQTYREAARQREAGRRAARREPAPARAQGRAERARARSSARRAASAWSRPASAPTSSKDQVAIAREPDAANTAGVDEPVIARDRARRARVSTIDPVAARRRAVTQVAPERGLAVRRASPPAGPARAGRPPGPSDRNRRDRLRRPAYSSGAGGIVSRASAVSSATTPVDVAGLERLGEARVDRALRARAGQRRLVARTGGRGRSRARCSALVTDASVSSSISATSAARKPSTSRRTSTARWRGGRRCSATMNASPIASRAS